MGRRFGLIDLMRGAAALLVLLSHVAFWTGASGVDVGGPLLARGDSGVAMFFAISAFLLLRPWTADRAPGLKSYAIRRAARILPAYLLALVAVLAVTLWRPAATGGPGGVGKVLAHLVLLQGYTADAYQSFTQTWSLTTEVTFYLLVPFIGSWLRSRRERAVPVLLIVAVGGVVLQALSAGPAPVLATSVLGHAAWFAMGALLAVPGSDRIPSALARLRTVPGLCLGTAGVVYLLVSSPLGGPVGLQRPTMWQAGVKELAYTALALLVLTAALTPRTGATLTAVEDSPVRRFAGNLSYGLFLWHVLVLQVLFVATGRRLFTGGFVPVLVADLIISAMIAWLSWTILESPLLRAAHRSTRGPVPVRQW